jgi:hypothetical protein
MKKTALFLIATALFVTTAFAEMKTVTLLVSGMT